METEKRLQKLKNKSRIISALLCICMLLCICSCTNKAVPITEEPNAPGQSENVTETKAPKDTTDYSEHSFAVKNFGSGISRTDVSLFGRAITISVFFFPLSDFAL